MRQVGAFLRNKIRWSFLHLESFALPPCFSCLPPDRSCFSLPLYYPISAHAFLQPLFSFLITPSLLPLFSTSFFLSLLPPPCSRFSLPLYYPISAPAFLQSLFSFLSTPQTAPAFLYTLVFLVYPNRSCVFLTLFFFLAYPQTAPTFSYRCFFSNSKYTLFALNTPCSH